MTYHQRIMNIPGDSNDYGYKGGHRDARHAAAEIAAEADAEVERLTAERDGLAKALATIAQDQDSGWPEDGPGERVPLHEADDMMAMARAALAALPPKEEA